LDHRAILLERFTVLAEMATLLESLEQEARIPYSKLPSKELPLPDRRYHCEGVSINLDFMRRKARHAWLRSEDEMILP
jgi:hypothetical protein